MATGAAPMRPKGGLIRDLLEGSFPELYPAPTPTPEPEEKEEATEAEAEETTDESPDEKETASLSEADASEKEPEVDDAVPETGSYRPPTPDLDAYAKRIAEIDAEADSRLQSLDAVSTHLESATTEAAAAERRALDVADAMYTVRHRHTGAPLPVFNPDLDPGLVSSYDLLDAKLLLAEHKLRLAKVHGDVSSSRAGRLHEIHLTELDDGDLETKTDTDPSYAASTKSVENRVAARRPRIQEIVPAYLRKSHQTLSDGEWRLKTAAARAVAASRKNEMTMSARDEEELVLRRMRARANFIPNPRHAVTDGGSENFHEIFAVDPPIVRFVEYEIGATYELRLTIRNKSHLSRRVRVVPTASRHFSVTECVWPSAHGVLAPGMACVTHVRFKPESLADYEDFVGVLGETCKGRVPIEAKRHPPRLLLDEVIDVGAVLVGGDVEFRVPFKNVGGSGRFRLVDENDWPELTTPLRLPNSTADIYPPSEFHDHPLVPCISLKPFRVGPGTFSLSPGEFEKLRVGFAPPKAGVFTKTFKMVCDNCQVKTFRVTGVGTVLDVAVVSIDNRDVIAGELAMVGDDEDSQPLRFQSCEPGSVTCRKFVVRNKTKVGLPFQWDFPGTRDEHVENTGEFCMELRCGILDAESVTEFTSTFAPTKVEPAIAGRFRLVIDAAFPPRSPGVNGAGAAAFAKPVVVEDFAVFGAGVPHEVKLDVHLVTFAGALLPGRHYDRDISVTNQGTAACSFAWTGADEAPTLRGGTNTLRWEDTNGTTGWEGEDSNGTNVSHGNHRGTNGNTGTTKSSNSSLVLIYPTHGVVGPGETLTCVVEISALGATSVDREIVLECKDGPNLPLRVTATVTAPEVVVAQSAIDFGLLRRNTPGDTYVLIRNPCAVPCAWRVEERREIGQQCEIVFSQQTGVLPPHGETEIECTLRPSQSGQYRSLVHVMSGGKEKGAVVHARADVLDPRAALSATRVNLGVVYVGVAVTREVFVQNLTMLPAAFRWSPYPEAESRESKDAMHVRCSTPKAEIAPGGKQAVRFTFTPTRAPCSSSGKEKENYSSLVACDVAGALLPLGFELVAEIQDLGGNVAYDVRRGSDGVLVASDATDQASRRVQVLDKRERNALGVDLGDAVRINFGDQNQVREHSVMELVVRNTSGIETTCDLGFLKFGVSDTTSRKAMANRRAATGASSGGRGWGGVDATRGNARALGGLAGGDGVVATTFTATARDFSDAKLTDLDDTIFGAVATAGPEAFNDAMRLSTNRKVGQQRTKTFHLPNATPNGDQLSFVGDGLDLKPKKVPPKKKITFARPKLSDKHESFKFSRASGVRMAHAKSSGEADQEALREAGGKGVAFLVENSHAVLPAFGEVRVLIGCVSDAPGEYNDTLVVRVGDLPARHITVTAGVAGSPLEVRQTKHVPAGLPRRGGGGAAGVAATVHGASPVFGLDWGETPVGAGALTKRFFVVNRGPHDAQVEFIPWLNPIPDDPSVYYSGEERDTVCASVSLAPDEIGGRVEVNVVGRGVMCARRGPFTVSPSGPVFVPKNGGQVQFEVAYSYKGQTPRHFVGSVVSKQKLLPSGFGDGGKRLPAGAPVTIEWASAVADATLSARSSNTVTDPVAMRHASINPLRVKLTGTFHENAAPPALPMKPLVVRLSAKACSPRVTPNAPVNLNWVCSASAPPGAREFQKSVTLRNNHTTACAFRITCPPPFTVEDVLASTPQQGLLVHQVSQVSRTGDTQQTGSTQSGAPLVPPLSLRDECSDFKKCDSLVGLRGVVWQIPAGQNLHVTLKFTPPTEDYDDFGNPVREESVFDEKTGNRQTLDGALVLLYENGDAQHFPLACELGRPSLHFANDVRAVDFGKIHLAAAKDSVASTKQVFVVNDSSAEARWRATSSSNFFSIHPPSGIVAGGGGRAAVAVRFVPDKEKEFKGVVRFEVEEGTGCTLACAGQGTLDEAEDA